MMNEFDIVKKEKAWEKAISVSTVDILSWWQIQRRDRGGRVVKIVFQMRQSTLERRLGRLLLFQSLRAHWLSIESQ